MKGKKYFLDTNIFIYSLENNQSKKARLSRELIATALKSGTGIISYQVVQEFLNVALSKFKKTIEIADCRSFLDTVLIPLCAILPGLELYHSAIEIRANTGYAFYDALIVASALAGDCSVLYSEDLQHQRTIHNIEIINPFI